MKKIITISDLSEIEILIDKVNNNIESIVLKLNDKMGDSTPYELFHDMKFNPIGQDPLESSKLNFIEQINQTFTYLVTFEGVKYLFNKHPEHSPYILNLGTASGADIISVDGKVTAEVFAAVNPGSNNKLKKDIDKLISEAYEDSLKYVFFYSPEKYDVSGYEKESGVRIIQIDLK